MAKKLKVIILALIISLCNFNTMIFAANTSEDNISLQNKENESEISLFASDTKKLQNTSKNIYVLYKGYGSRDGLKDTIKNEYNDFKDKKYTEHIKTLKSFVQQVAKDDKSKYTEAYNNIDKVYNYYKNNLGISGVDNKGSKGIPLFVLPNFKMNEAFFIDRGKAVFIGLGEYNKKSYASALDAVGHEYTHLVLWNTYGLPYKTIDQQSLHEGISDYFGSIIGKNSWKIANSVLGQKNYLRNIANPSEKSTDIQYTDAQGRKRSKYPDHYSQRYTGNSDQYINSTIVSHLLYTIQSKMGGGSDNQLKTAKLALRTLSDKSSHDSIANFGYMLYKKAYNSEKKAVKSALKEVGLYPSISLNVSKCDVLVNKSKTLKATISPKSQLASNTLTWSSSNKNIATVKNGVVTGVSTGTATITASIKIGDDTEKVSCKVTVKPYQRKVPLSVKVPSNYTGEYSVQILDENNKVLKTLSKTKGSKNYSFTYTLNSQSASYKRKVRIVTSKNKYTSSVFTINKNTIDKNITATFKDKKVTITQK